METLSKLVQIIIISAFFSLFYIMGVVFCTGHGGRLLGGYHYQPKTKRAMIYHKKLMLRVGIWFIFITLFIHAAVICAVYFRMIEFGVLLGVSVIVAIGGVIYLNSSKKMARLMQLEKDDYIDSDEKMKNNKSDE